MDAEVSQLLRIAEPGLEARWRALVPSPGAPLSQAARRRLAGATSPAFARFASLQVELSGRSTSRFPDGRMTFWTSKGLEQATPAAVADYRAGQVAASSEAFDLVWDTSCGVGSDALAFARRGFRVLATDMDAASARCAHGNLAIQAETARGVEPAQAHSPFLVARSDLRRPPVAGAELDGAFVLVDPDRRPDGTQREGRPDRWSPTLSEALKVASQARAGCVKLPPGLDPGPLTTDPSTRLEWISLDGELKELTLWTGAAGPRALRTATKLSSAGTCASWAEEAPAAPSPLEDWPMDELRPGLWLIELDVSLWQSGLAPAFAAQQGFHPLDQDAPPGMFLISPEPPPKASPFCRGWAILGATTADRKRVRALLREHGIGPVTVKKRNHPKASVELEALYRGPGDARGLLAVFRTGSASGAVLLQPA